MKHLTLYGPVIVAAMALMALTADSACATALYNGTTRLAKGSTLDLSTTTTAKLTNTAGTENLDECNSTLKLSVTNEGGSGVAVSANISELSWTTCPNPTTTDALGGLEVAVVGTGTEGTVRANAEIGYTVTTVIFGLCKYGAEKGTHLGTIKSTVSGTATFTANAVTKKLSGSSIACPETAKWVATYTSTDPDNLRVETS